MKTKFKLSTILVGVLIPLNWGFAADGPYGVWRSSDQLVWTRSESKFELDLDQPELVLLGKPTPSRVGPDAGAILVYGVRGGEMVVGRSVDQGKSWSAVEKVTFNGWPKGSEGARAEGPSIVQLDDGRVRMYFSASVSTEKKLPDWITPPDDSVPEAPMIPPPEPKRKKRPESPLNPGEPKGGGDAGASATTVSELKPSKIMSAISNDGVTFAVEDGVRFELEGVDEPEVIRLPEVSTSEGGAVRRGPWLIFLRRGSSVLMATSKDGLAWVRDETFLWSGVGGTSAVVAAEEVSGAKGVRGIRLFGRSQSGAVSGVYDPTTGKVMADTGKGLPASDEDAAVTATGDGAYMLIRRERVADKPRGPETKLPGSPPVPLRPGMPKPKN